MWLLTFGYDEKNMKRWNIIAAGIILGVGLTAALLFVGPRSQTRVIDRPYGDVVAYLCRVFKTDLTQTGLHSAVWGPTFLDPTTQYFTETYDFSENGELNFQARYYQIGGEDDTFNVRKLSNTQTVLTVNHVIRFFAVFSKCTGKEISILNAIEDDLRNDARTSGDTERR